MSDSSARQAMMHYANLDPRAAITDAEFNRILLGTDNSRHLAALSVRANVMLERGTASDVSLNRRRSLVGSAAGILTKQTVRGSFLFTDDQSMMLREFLPVFSSGFSERVRSGQVDKMTRLLGLYEDKFVATGNGMYRGRPVEIVTAMLINNVGIEGVTAVPSFARQESNGVKVDGKKYCWDFTASSDGRTIDQGIYRLQVKSSYSDFRYFHPDLVRVVGTTTLGIDSSDPNAIFEFGDEVVASARAGAKPSSSVAQARDSLCEVLQFHGPIAEAA